MNIFNESELSKAIGPTGETTDVDRDAIREILRQILDPELGVNIVDLGLVYGIESDDAGIRVTMTMTTPGCPMHESIITAAERALRHHYPAREVNVNLVWEPAWTLERLSPDARRMLGRY